MLIRLKKYLNPHENSCSKVISILTTGNILHESSSAPNQYNSGSRDFCQSYLVLSLFYSLQGGGGGQMVLLLRKLYLYFTKNQEGVHYFPGKGVPNFFQGGGSKC